SIIYLSFYCHRALRDLHSFPTRRSSDLGPPGEKTGCELMEFEIQFLFAQGNSLGSKPGGGVLFFERGAGEEDVTNAPQPVSGGDRLRARELSDGGPEFGFVVFGLLTQAGPAEELGNRRNRG